MAETAEDTPVTIPVLSNDTDIDGDALTLESVTQPANGTAALNADGTATFVPSAGFHGITSFIYTIADTSGETATGTVTVTVHPVNDPPVANDDAAATEEDTPVTLDVLANDSDPDGDTLTITSVTQPSNGSAAVTADNRVTYSPTLGFHGADSFSYTISDGSGGTATATVSITVHEVNDAPLAVDDHFSVDEDSASNVLDVLANDSDPDGTLALASVTQPASGTTSINADGTVSYTPNANFSGMDTFGYTVCDDDGECRSAIVMVTVNEINDPPVISGDQAATEENTSVTIQVLANDSDIDGTLDPASVKVLTAPANGTAVVDAQTGEITYTPAFYFRGADSFTYEVCDDDGACGSAAVSVNVVLGEVADNVVRLDFREITYFNRNQVITSSDPQVRASNGIQGGFDPSLWPYAPDGGPNKTRSRGTLFRVYGFAAERAGQHIQDANDWTQTYEIVEDTEIGGVYYIDLGRAAAVYIPISYLQKDLTIPLLPVTPWSLPGTGKLHPDKLNVPGIMLNHNVGVVRLPRAIKQQLGTRRPFGLLDYVGLQVWGHGNPKFREFVDVEIKFIYDAVDHERYGFRTAVNGNFEGHSRCTYVDFAAGADTARFNDVWSGVHVDNPHYGPACGELEPPVNQKVRANYDLAPDAIQLLPSVNVHNDTTRIFYGEIRTRDSED